MQRNKFHLLTQNSKLNMQTDFIFVDTETKRKNKEEVFHLGWLIYWNKPTNTKDYFYFTDKKEFYNYITKLNRTANKLIVFAHNMDFDIKVLGGITPFTKKNYVVKNFYINGARFIIRLAKKDKLIELLDTMNYLPASLKYIGSSIGLPKKEIDFNICSDHELSEYCRRDTEIIYLFIYKLIEFLEKYQLSKLQPTCGSLAFNIFRHAFYNQKTNPIYIHKWRFAIDLERASYKGGISDCFVVGKNITEKLFKLDINSMYPFIMRNNAMPIKLIWFDENLSPAVIQSYFKEYLNEKLIIAECKIFLPKEYAYILTKCKVNKEHKSLFLAGTFINTFTTPELEFILKYGKILEIYKMAVYNKSIIFKEFVDFFYTKRMQFSKDKNEAYKMFCKYILNNLYGKFGQTTIDYLETEKTGKPNFNSKEIIDGINHERYIQMTFGNKIFEVTQKEGNSYESFVAIPSFVTAYARMYLIELILKAKRENVYYVDTDSLVVNQEGYNNLLNEIDPSELGKLKLEEVSYDSSFFRPKYYIFNEIEKCKGVKKTAKKLFENDDTLIIEQEQFTRFKTSMRKNNLDQQTISIITKTMNKEYDKGIILETGLIEPYYVDSNEAIPSLQKLKEVKHDTNKTNTNKATEAMDQS
jgi:hypothetical protein